MNHLRGDADEALVPYFSRQAHDCLAAEVDPVGAALVSSLLQSTPHPVAVVDCGLTIVAANPPAMSLAGLEGARLPMPLDAFIGPDAAEHMERLFTSTSARTASFAATVTAGGASRGIHVMAYRLLDEAGRTIGLGMSLAASLRDAPRSSFAVPERVEALGLYAAGIVHEFNNLISVIAGRAGLGLMAQGAKAKNHALENVITAARRAEHITKNLLAYVQRLEPDMVLADLRAPVQEALLLLEIELASAHIDVVRRFRPMPMVTCDPVQISQVCFNLLRNAREAMPDGGTITVDVSRADGWAVVKVADTGRGIPPELQARIFDPFVSYGRTQSFKPSGTGLGLFITKEIVLGHGGDIAIDSAPGRGSTFTIRLPLARKT